LRIGDCGLRIERETEYNADCRLRIVDWNKKREKSVGIADCGMRISDLRL